MNSQSVNDAAKPAATTVMKKDVQSIRSLPSANQSTVLPSSLGKATVPYGRLRFDEACADGVADHAGGFVYAQLLQNTAAVGVGGFVADAEARGGFLGRFALGARLRRPRL